MQSNSPNDSFVQASRFFDNEFMSSMQFFVNNYNEVIRGIMEAFQIFWKAICDTNQFIIKHTKNILDAFYAFLKSENYQAFVKLVADTFSEPIMSLDIRDTSKLDSMIKQIDNVTAYAHEFIDIHIGDSGIDIKSSSQTVDQIKQLSDSEKQNLLLSKISTFFTILAFIWTIVNDIQSCGEATEDNQQNYEYHAQSLEYQKRMGEATDNQTVEKDHEYKQLQSIYNEINLVLEAVNQLLA